MPGSDAGGQSGQTAQSGQSGLPGSDSRGPAGQAGNALPSYGEAGTGNGGLIYGSEDDPFGTIGSNTTGAGSDNGAGNEAGGNSGDTASGRAAAGSVQARVGELDARLEESYGEFDGMILSERERTQGMGENEQSAQTRDNYGGGGGMPRDEDAAGAGGSGGDQGGPIIARNSSSNAGGGYMPNSSNREGEFDNGPQGEQHPVPADIPAGNNDDVVARQLREAAMSEPDPEVRERLWNEYRRYTGLPVNDGNE